MSTYVMSDLHGNYDAYITMLKKINFSDNDMLYILGDILDRGPNPIKIILDLMERFNVEILAGNHCVMALDCLKFLMQEITEETISNMPEDIVEKILDWEHNGARTTIAEFLKCSREMQNEIIEFISNFELYDEVEINDETYIMVHAGLGNFSPNKPMWEYELDELVWERTDYEIPYFDDKYVITGHTPTMSILGNPKPGYIYKGNNHIAIDCGCYFPGGRLACLRLEDMKEFYVEWGDY